MMRHGFYLVFILLFIASFALGGCNVQQEEPAPPEETEEPAAPEEPQNEEEKVGAWKEVDQLEPEKTAVVIVEGMEEEITLRLQVSEQHPYAVYLDEERYSMEEREGKDFIVPRAEVEPEVFMALWHRDGIEMAALLREIEEQLQEEHIDVQAQGQVDTPLPAQKFLAVSGTEWDDPVERYYIVEDFEGGAYIIQQKLFHEAVEGHGARFDSILEEFFGWHPQKGEFVQLSQNK